MGWFIKTKGRLIGTGIFLTGCLLPLAGWQLMRPELGHATLAEIEAALPPDLRGNLPVDEAACKRMDRLQALCKIHWGSEKDQFTRPEDFSNHRFNAAKRVWAKHSKDFTAIRHLLGEGSLQLRPTLETNRPSVLPELEVVRKLSFTGITFAQGGDLAGAKAALDLSCHLSASIRRGGRDLTDYLYALLFDGISDSSLQSVAYLRDCLPVLCRHWLADSDPAQMGDPILASAQREEFRKFVVPSLANSEKFARDVILGVADAEQYDGPLFGTFDPISTARTQGHFVELRMENANRPLSEYDDTVSRLEKAETLGLPSSSKFKPGLPLDGETIKFMALMNNTSNSLGRQMVANYLHASAMFGYSDSDKLMISNSCAYRAQMEWTRVLLATRLYRHDHAGHLPNTLNDLVPTYLSSLPIDPFNGKPMLYNASKQVVYSVGRDFVDGHGNIKTRTEIKGISLALTR